MSSTSQPILQALFAEEQNNDLLLVIFQFLGVTDLIQLQLVNRRFFAFFNASRVSDYICEPLFNKLVPPFSSCNIYSEFFATAAASAPADLASPTSPAEFNNNNSSKNSQQQVNPFYHALLEKLASSFEKQQTIRVANYFTMIKLLASPIVVIGSDPYTDVTTNVKQLEKMGFFNVHAFKTDAKSMNSLVVKSNSQKHALTKDKQLYKHYVTYIDEGLQSLTSIAKGYNLSLVDYVNKYNESVSSSSKEKQFKEELPVNVAVALPRELEGEDKDTAAEATPAQVREKLEQRLQQRKALEFPSQKGLPIDIIHFHVQNMHFPTLHYLKQFAAVFIFGDSSAFGDHEFAGDTMYEYVMRGYGGVVVSTYAHNSNVTNGYLANKFIGICPIPQGSQTSAGSDTNLKILESKHLSMWNCSDVRFEGDMSDKSVETKFASAHKRTLLAQFDDKQRVLCAAEVSVNCTSSADSTSSSCLASQSSVIGLNFFPKFTEEKTVNYKGAEKLIVNSLLHVLLVRNLSLTSTNK